MTAIPENTVTQEDLNLWYTMQDQLRALKASEMLLRQKIFKGFFTAPKEGTNTHPLANGWVLKGGYTITREVDMAALTVFKDRFNEAHINADALVQYKPSLIKSVYNTLTEEQRRLFDNALVIKPGSPSLEIVLPAKAKKVGEAA
jgi:hypothetical protein